MIFKGSCWRIGNGNTTKIWGDNWIPSHHEFKVMTTGNSNQHNSKVKELINIESPNWDLEILHSLLLPLDHAHIQQIPLLNLSNQDELMWMYAIDGIYSVKSRYKAIKEWQTQSKTPSATSSSKSTVWKKIWALNTISRHKVMIWSILQNSLPVRSELNKGGIPCSILCPICNFRVETITHAFMTCPDINITWFGSRLTIKFSDCPNPNFVNWLFDFILHNKESTIIEIGAIIYSIWHARNLSIYENQWIHEEKIILRAENSLRDLFSAQMPKGASAAKSHLSPSSNTHLIRSNLEAPQQRVAKWRKPKLGFVKANSDANMKVLGHWGLGAIIRNEKGLVMAAATWLSPGSDDLLLAEAYALFRTMVLARDCGFQRIIFESDSKLLVHKVKDERIHNRSYLGYLIEEIRRQQCLFATCSFNFTHRSGNKVAHHMAQLAHEKPNEVWIEEMHVAINNMYFHDLMN